MSQVIEAMTCEEFYDSYSSAQDMIDEYVQDQYWDGGCNTESMFRALCALAKEKGVTLTDEADWSYDDFFYNVYQCTEKGLS